MKAANYRKYERMDEVLFRLAYLLQTIGKEEQAREFFLRLIKDYPNSKYIPNAYLSFAQFYFDKGEMEAAKKFYEKVEQFPKSDVYGYAIYKKGWCLHQPGRLQDRPGDLRRGDQAGPGRQGQHHQAGQPVAGARGEEGRGQGLRPHARAPAPTAPGTSSPGWAATSPPR